MQLLKQKLLNKCTAFISEREAILQKAMSDIRESLLHETKSTAGDKHETGRAMLQLEREKIGNQLQITQKLKNNLRKIDLNNQGEHIKLGSIVFTSQYHYFIAISAGKITENEYTFFAIAPDTPIGKLLLGKTIGDRIYFNKTEITITDVF